jgi:predicted porin
LAYTLAPENPVSRFFWHIRAKFQLAGNFALRYEDGKMNDPIYEGDGYFVVRWRNFPWNRYLATTLAIGEGVSYVSRVPQVEEEDNDNTKKLLNYLMLEATFALPRYPRTQILYRIHHRSGVFGAYGAGNSGSNTIGVGLRYHF